MAKVDIRILNNFPLPSPGIGGEVKYHFSKLVVNGDPLFVPFADGNRRKTIANVQASARSWALYKGDGTKVATRVIRDPNTQEEGIGVWLISLPDKET